MSQPIFSRAPLHMRYSRESLFEPKFVSIGPLYYEKQKEQKVIKKAKDECISYFASKLPKTNDSDQQIKDLDQQIKDLIEQINVTEVNDQIYEWYGKKNVGLNKGDLYKMLVCDSCFIIRIILAFSREGEESMFDPGVDIKTVRFDLLLMENQIPFFFLEKVYNFFRDNDMLRSVTPNSNSPSILTPEQNQNHSSTYNPSSEQSQNHSSASTPTVEHSQNHSSPFTLSPMQSQRQSQGSQSFGEQTTIFIDGFLTELKPFIWLDMPWQFNEQAPIDPIHLLDIYWKWCIPSPSNSQDSNPPNLPNNYKVDLSWGKIHVRSNAHKRIKNAYELYKRAGVKFQKSEHKEGFAVTFRNGKLQIPHLQLDPNQTTLLANLVAFEDSKPSNERFLTSYVLLLDGLIKTEKDVELLQRHGVITNRLSSSQVASTYFNDIGNVCLVDYEYHHCQKQFDDLNSFYNSFWHHQFAKLKHEYFNSTWAVISFLAGLTLLILSAIQTHYSIARYHQHC